LLAAVAHHVWMWRRGRTNLLGRALLLVAVTLAFGAAGLESNVLVAVALLTTFHNLQYIGLVWFHNQTRAERGAAEGNPLIGLLAKRQLWIYLALSIGYGGVIFLPRLLVGRTRFGELPVTLVVALHYYVDGRAWRFDLYPERGQWLRLKG
ncbi:MAG: hypothetical protein JST92_20900, partial [Deltaproteobacteria bacterium]|nr:hypothetical protein [Deltaproteobacteria bacterium]